MKKVLSWSAFAVFICINLFFTQQASAQLPLPGEEKYDSIINQNRVITKIASASGTENSLKNIFTGGDVSLILGINAIIAAIAVLWIVVLATKFIGSQGEEEKIANYKKQFGFIVMGLFVVSIAEFTAFTLLDPQTDIIKDGQDAFIKNFYTRIDVAIAFIRYVVGGVVIIVGGMSAYKLVTSGDQDDKRASEKTFLKAFLLGTVFILLAETMVRIFSLETRTGGSVSQSGAVEVGIIEIAGLINFILGFIGAIGFISLIIAALYYIISFGQEEQVGKAKKMILYSIIAIIVSISAYSISSYMVQNYNNSITA